MDEHVIRELIADVTHGRLPRRRFLELMVGAGLTLPMAAGLLAPAGVARAQTRPPAPGPVRRGGGGQIRMLYWAAPTLLNPHLAVAPKDFESSQLFYEPLADIDTDGNVVPVLAAETPSVANGGVAADGTRCTVVDTKGIPSCSRRNTTEYTTSSSNRRIPRRCTW